MTLVTVFMANQFSELRKEFKDKEQANLWASRWRNRGALVSVFPT
jgi:hypothetical protein